MTFRALEERPGVAPWAGTLFALGHGGVVAIIAVLASVWGASVTLPAPLVLVLEWAPVALLVLLGTLNLRSLLKDSPYRPVGVKAWAIPSFLGQSNHPLAMVAIGAVFALVFDTATQAAAWGIAASSHGGLIAAVAVGVCFAVGMGVTDTLDGRLMCRFLAATRHEAARRYRRGVGWFTVIASYAVAVYAVATAVRASWTLDDAWLTGLGVGLVAVLVAGTVLANLRVPRSADA